MKYQLAKPFLLLVAVIMVVSLACGIDMGGDESAPVQEPAPVQESAPPAVDPPTAVPAPAEPVAQEFYTEEFEGDTSLWTYFVVNGTKAVPTFSEDDFGTMFVGTDDGRLTYSLESEGQWAYVTYDGHEYDNVRLDVTAENRGVNNNNVSLICRYTPDEGWYEFNMANNGLYWIYHAVVRSDGAVIYTELADGGSNKIKAGKEVNQYSIICDGRTLSLFINGYETRVMEENNYALRDGKIGVSVSSFGTLPVKVELDAVTISQP
ncbi:MAG: DUF1080 domain-containing protein [Anaerolineae bacterium]|jgi:hypothetical protein|nr:DUF1080 domain-containing protein [Anaerolineae bacterium]MBT7069588.1 DUF1080 domain-containing protein [Anaerolineae bacterium]MBT7323727.1 DUF1080 domain-containing protein [Anaerolineae bacterium]